MGSSPHFTYAYINVANIVLLLILAIKAKKSGIDRTKMRFVFLLSIYFAVAMNIFDCAWCLILNFASPRPVWLLKFVNNFYFLSFALSAYLWFVYSEYTYKKTIFINNAGKIISLCPIFALIALYILNDITGWLYHFDFDSATNDYVYIRGGWLYYFQHVLSYAYIVLASIKFAIIGSKMTKKDVSKMLTMISFALPPLVCAILQPFFQTVPILSSSPVFSFLIVYTNTLNAQVSLDPLTGIYNRRRLSIELSKRIKYLPPKHELYFLFMDVDAFKDLNDTYGHNEGDKTLLLIAEVLASIAEDTNSICARYGGDEFAFVLTLPEDSDVNDVVTRIEESIHQKSIAEKFRHTVSVSIGITKFNKEIDNANSLIVNADKKMYQTKLERYGNTDKIINNTPHSDLVLSENLFLEKLFSVHFDGAILIDVNEDKIVEINRFITKKMARYLDIENVSFTQNIANCTDIYVAEVLRERFKQELSIPFLVEKLKKVLHYFTDFQFSPPGSDKIMHKRLNFRYYDENKKFIMCSMEDITSAFSNDIDPLTGIYDSTGFHKKVDRWIAENPGKKFRIQRYNIDNFKDINGVYGYDIGDKLLKDIGNYMYSYSTDDYFCGHLSADNFARFCPEGSMSPQESYELFLKFFSKYGLSIPINIHIGIYDLCEEGESPYRMSYKALLALQKIKYDLNNHYAYYERGMSEKEQEQLEMLREIQTAIVKNQFEVYFQPQVDFEKKKVFCAEALVRWNHPTKGLVAPGKFIPLLEKSNYISKVDIYVIDKTCKYLRKWMDELGRKDIKVSVNLSRKDIIDKHFLDLLERTIDFYKLPHSSINLEVTESAYMQDTEKITNIINYLREKGFSIEIDDFGSGYSSLNTLKELTVDKIKLDMKFLSDNSDKSKHIISNMIKLSKDLETPIIAEGVETLEQAKMLYEFGCNQMQGYYFSKPLPAEKYEALIYGKSSLENLK